MHAHARYPMNDDVSVIDDTPRMLTADSIPAEAVSSSVDPEAAK